MKITAPLKNEDGIALIIALMLLVLLTLLGMAATTTSLLEIQIADNNRDYKVNFYRAETAAYEAARNMGNAPDPINQIEGKDGGYEWIGIDKDVSDETDLADLNNWEGALTANTARSSDYNSNEAAYAANFVYIYEKEMTKDYSMRIFRLFGRSKDRSAQALVELGLKLTYETYE